MENMENTPLDHSIKQNENMENMENTLLGHTAFTNMESMENTLLDHSPRTWRTQEHGEHAC